MEPGIWMSVVNVGPRFEYGDGFVGIAGFDQAETHLQRSERRVG
jgi:hypothetical protein